MILSQEQLEWIVREVVRRLRETTGEGDSTADSGNGRLTIAEKLVTIETVRDKLGSVKCVEVPGRAIVTPAVVDWLKDKQIELVRL